MTEGGIAEFGVIDEMIREVFANLPEDTRILSIRDGIWQYGHRVFMVRVWSPLLPPNESEEYFPLCQPTFCRVQDGVYFDSWGLL